MDDVTDLFSNVSSVSSVSSGYGGYGTYQHATGMKEDPTWNFAGILADGVGFVQPIAQAAGARAQAMATTAAGAEGAAKFVAGAATPIIEAGLWVLLGMTTNSGFGTPDRGHDFSTGADAFEQIRASLGTTDSPESWSGEGAAAYDGQNRRQRDRAHTMSQTDASLTAVLASEGADVEDLRAFIDRRTTMLTLSIPAAIAAKAIPDAGLAIAAGIELAAVAGSVPSATARFLELAARTVDNAHRVRDLAAEYDRIGTEPAPEHPAGGAELAVTSTDLLRLSTSQKQVAVNAVTAGRTTEETSWNVGRQPRSGVRTQRGCRRRCGVGTHRRRGQDAGDVGRPRREARHRGGRLRHH